MMSVDILPTALPLEASQHFSSVLLPYLRTLIRGYQSIGSSTSGTTSLMENVEEEERVAALERATVASGGKLRPTHEWLQEPLSVWMNDSQTSASSSTPSTSQSILEKKKRVLVLGSGMVAGPAIEEICSWQDAHLVVGEFSKHSDIAGQFPNSLVTASNILSEAERLTNAHENATAVAIDVSDLEKVGQLIGESDVVIRSVARSLRPCCDSDNTQSSAGSFPP